MTDLLARTVGPINDQWQVNNPLSRHQVPPNPRHIRFELHRTCAVAHETSGQRPSRQRYPCPTGALAKYRGKRPAADRADNRPNPPHAPARVANRVGLFTTTIPAILAQNVQRRIQRGCRPPYPYRYPGLPRRQASLCTPPTAMPGRGDRNMHPALQRRWTLWRPVITLGMNPPLPRVWPEVSPFNRQPAGPHGPGGQPIAAVLNHVWCGVPGYSLSSGDGGQP